MFVNIQFADVVTVRLESPNQPWMEVTYGRKTKMFGFNVSFLNNFYAIMIFQHLTFSNSGTRTRVCCGDGQKGSAYPPSVSVISRDGLLNDIEKLSNDYGDDYSVIWSVHEYDVYSCRLVIPVGTSEARQKIGAGIKFYHSDGKVREMQTECLVVSHILQNDLLYNFS